MTTRVREDPALAAAAPPLESGMDHAATASLLSTLWDDSVLPALSDFIAVESQSPLFDPEWETNGLLDKSVAILVEWVRAQKVEGLTVEVRPPPLTPHPTPPLDSRCWPALSRLRRVGRSYLRPGSRPSSSSRSPRPPAAPRPAPSCSTGTPTPSRPLSAGRTACLPTSRR